ncbi:MAG TPA: trimeric intracellular cation channel family protein [Armatimonadota bacterium]|nr:trimeric intracellular cation channel family protein [Armatimonadota bacterium]
MRPPAPGPAAMWDFSTILQLLDYLGTFAFGLSGAMVGVRKQMDVFGVVVLATVTAIGGGTARDVMIGRAPTFWMTDPTYLGLALIAGLIPFIAAQTVERRQSALIAFDAIGLGVFTVIGAWLAIQAEVSPIAVVALATLTAVGGGMMRDLLAGEVPIVLREEVYASASIVGAVVFWAGISAGLPQDAVAPAAAVLVIAIRLVSRKYRWQLPRPEHVGPEGDA